MLAAKAGDFSTASKAMAHSRCKETRNFQKIREMAEIISQAKKFPNASPPFGQFVFIGATD